MPVLVMSGVHVQGTPNSATNLTLPEPNPWDRWRIEIRRHCVAALDARSRVVARLPRKHPAMSALEEWHQRRWGDLCAGDVYDSQGREVMAFIAGVKAVST